MRLYVNCSKTSISDSLQWFDEFATTTVSHPVQLSPSSSTGAQLSSSSLNFTNRDNEDIMENLEIIEIPILWSEGLQINIPDEIMSGNEPATCLGPPSSPATPKFRGKDTEVMSTKARRTGAAEI